MLVTTSGTRLSITDFDNHFSSPFFITFSRLEGSE